MPILEWLNKGEAIKTADRVPYRLLQADSELSYGEPNGNMLIKGDNLEALKALLPYYKGQVKCIYIDPPYNTGSAFEKYDDNLEHSTWLSLLYPRLELLRELLNENGLILISIDDREHAYLKVICDEIFGRSNFVCTFIWEARSGQGNTIGHIAENHEYILCYAKNIQEVSFKKITNVANKGNYSDEKGSYKREQLRQWGQGDRREDRPTMYYAVTAPSGEEIYPFRPDNTDGRWRVSKAKMDELIANNDVDFVKDENGRWLLYKKIRDGRVTYSAHGTLLTKIGTASTATIELKELFLGIKIFDTPKPEVLIQHLLNLVTNENDLVLDSFLGSGTTAAVAHKMNRHYIGIEMGEHAITTSIPRLKAVIDGEQGGISKAVNWQGGGGFTFYDLGETVFDENGNINPKVDFKTLASHIWFVETKTPLLQCEKSPLLGVHNETAYYLLYNGILGDKKVDGGNVLTSKIYEALPNPKEPFSGKKIIYGEASRLSSAKLKELNITFKQTPYDVKAR
ncbi:MAG: site-specific DNA-methyltransferase [Heliobacteriaceae bacterium]|jgi:adenine-specific DNA-methyltransferase|nr:site-specific DNA-methyltransferase [Heliobacteriaceae bacterium]